MADINAFSIAKRILIHSQIDERTIFGNSLFFYVFVILFHKKERFSYGHRFKRRIEKRDKLLAGYLKQIEIQEEFIQKQKEMIEYLEDYISKITDIISGV
ncbi:MAG: hypothetical protein ACLU8S_14280 [Coprococcus phoceensis]